MKTASFCFYNYWHLNSKNMKRITQLLCVSIITLLMTNCKTTETTTTTEISTDSTTVATPSVNDLSALTGSTWQLIGITFYEKDQYINRPEKEKGLTITFNEQGKFSYTLTVNRCTGTYSAEADTLVINSLGVCTKVCCDSESAMDFQEILTGAKSYKIHGEQYLDINCEEKILKLEKVTE